jgi:hypothetical protein
MAAPIATAQARRQEAYYAAQTEALQALEAIKQALLTHGAGSALAKYQYGQIAYMQALAQRLWEVQHD